MARNLFDGLLPSYQVGVRGTASFPSSGGPRHGGAELTINGPARVAVVLAASNGGFFLGGAAIAPSFFIRGEGSGAGGRAIVGGGIAGAVGAFPFPAVLTGELGVGFNTATQTATLRTSIGLESIVPTPAAIPDSCLSVGLSYVSLFDPSNGQVEHGLSFGVRVSVVNGPPPTASSVANPEDESFGVAGHTEL